MDNKIMKDEVEKEINGLSYDLNEYLINNKEAKIKLQRLLDLTDKSEKIVFQKGSLSKEKDVLKILDELIKIKTEERVLWEHNLLRNGKSIAQRGYFKNPDFQIQANAMIYILEELKNRINQNDKRN